MVFANAQVLLHQWRMGRISVKVVPGASRTEVTGWHGDAIKIRVKAPPVDGKANEAVVAYLAEKLGLKQNLITLVTGETSRLKIFDILDGNNAECTKKNLLK